MCASLCVDFSLIQEMFATPNLTIPHANSRILVKHIQVCYISLFGYVVLLAYYSDYTPWFCTLCPPTPGHPATVAGMILVNALKVRSLVDEGGVCMDIDS